jgi:hypothetical protein
MVSVQYKNIWKEKESECNILIICRYVNVVKNQRKIIKQTKNSQEIWEKLRNKSRNPECVLSFNMDWRILVFYPETEARDKID